MEQNSRRRARTCGGVYLLDLEMQGGHHLAKCQAVLCPTEQDEGLAGLVVGHAGQRDDRLLLELVLQEQPSARWRSRHVCRQGATVHEGGEGVGYGDHRFAEVQGDRDVLQHLLGHGVGAVELEHEVGLEDVLDQGDAVLRLLLRQHLGLRRQEGRPQPGQLWHPLQDARVVAPHLRMRPHSARRVSLQRGVRGAGRDRGAHRGRVCSRLRRLLVLLLLLGGRPGDGVLQATTAAFSTLMRGGGCRAGRALTRWKGVAWSLASR